MKRKIEIKWGIIFSVMILVWMLLERLAGLHDQHLDKHPIFTNLIAIPAIAIYYFALVDKRKNYYNGKMNYKQSFISGLILTLVITILSPLTQVIALEIITPHYFSNVIQYSVENGKMSLEEATNYFNLRNYIIQGTIGTIIMGILTSAIVSLFTNSKNKTTSPVTKTQNTGIEDKII